MGARADLAVSELPGAGGGADQPNTGHVLQVPPEMTVPDDSIAAAVERHTSELEARDKRIAELEIRVDVANRAADVLTTRVRELEVTIARTRTEAFADGYHAGRLDAAAARRGEPVPHRPQLAPEAGGMVIIRPSSALHPYCVARVMRIDGDTALVKVAGVDPFVVAFEDCQAL